jgi:hypothetical protein
MSLDRRFDGMQLKEKTDTLELQLLNCNERRIYVEGL